MIQFVEPVIDQSVDYIPPLGSDQFTMTSTMSCMCQQPWQGGGNIIMHGSTCNTLVYSILEYYLSVGNYHTSQYSVGSLTFKTACVGDTL